MGEPCERKRVGIDIASILTQHQGRAREGFFMSALRRLAAAVSVWSALAAPAIAQATLRLVPHSDLKVLDPVWTTAYITRNHGYMIYDTLFAKDSDLHVQPQMVDKYESSPDRLTWTFILRDGLQWSDGTPVTAEDCIASIKRWGARDAMGQLLMT